MKIAILTQPLGNNYGGILQNFALQTVLRRMGHQPVTLKTPVPDARYTPFRLVLSCCKRALKKYLFRDPSIESWLDGIAGAEYVVTDSFHGTVFSIIFKKRFLAVGNSARGNARFESLLSKCGLLERLATIDAVDCSRLVAMIDYKMVEELLELEQTKAIDFLNKTLK